MEHPNYQARLETAELSLERARRNLAIAMMGVQAETRRLVAWAAGEGEDADLVSGVDLDAADWDEGPDVDTWEQDDSSYWPAAIGEDDLEEGLT